MRKENSDFKTCYLSEAGKQLENRDYFAFVEENDFACWVMATSIDESDSQNSAELAVKSILDSFILKPSMSSSSLNKLIREAHDLLVHESVRDRLQASVMIVVTDYMKVRWASAGNVHLQCVYNNKLRFFSKDQSYYQEMVDREIFPLDRSAGFEERSNLTSYLGMPGRFKPFISEKRKLHELDSLVLTTVGMWEHVSDLEILDALHEAKSSQEGIDNMEDLLLSKQPDPLNNYTVAIIMINKLFVKSKERWKKIKRILLIAIPILIVLGIILFMVYRSNVKRAEQIDKVEQLVLKADEFVEEDNYKRALEKYEEALKLGGDIKKFSTEDVDTKEKMTQLIIDGLASLEKDDSETAKKYLTDARNLKVDHDKLLDIFSQQFLQEQLDYLAQKIYIEDLEKLGDTQTEAEQYADAIETYQKAKLAAVELNDQASVKDLNVKLETARSMQNLADKDKNKADADQAASEAEQAGEDGESNEDLAARYDAIADQYDEAGFSDKASQMRAKAEQLRAESETANSKQQEEIASKLESDGDAYLLEKNYDVAIEFYEAAQVIYEDTGNSARVMQVQRKIDTAVNLKTATTEISGVS